LRGNNDDGSARSDWGGPANLNAYCHGAGITTDYRGSRNVPRPDNANVTNTDPYPGPVYGHSKHPTVQEQERGGYPYFGSAPGGGGAAAGGAFTSPDTIVPLRCAGPWAARRVLAAWGTPTLPIVRAASAAPEPRRLRTVGSAPPS